MDLIDLKITPNVHGDTDGGGWGGWGVAKYWWDKEGVGGNVEGGGA